MDLWGLVGRLASIILLDLVLSGDNAVVIGMATRALAPVQRRRAILLGGAGAVLLRAAFTAGAALLLDVPLLMAAGGVLLTWIALKLLGGGHDAEEAGATREAGGMTAAVRTIIVADLVMSLDNMLAVGGAAHGELWLLLFGLFLSIPILLLGSGLVAALIDRFGWLNWVGSAILAWTAGSMLAEDPILHHALGAVPADTLLIPAATVLLVGAIALARRGARPKTPPEDAGARANSPASLAKHQPEVR